MPTVTKCPGCGLAIAAETDEATFREMQAAKQARNGKMLGELARVIERYRQHNDHVQAQHARRVRR